MSMYVPHGIMQLVEAETNSGNYQKVDIEDFLYSVG